MNNRGSFQQAYFSLDLPKTWPNHSSSIYPHAQYVVQCYHLLSMKKTGTWIWGFLNYHKVCSEFSCKGLASYSCVSNYYYYHYCITYIGVYLEECSTGAHFLMPCIGNGMLFKYLFLVNCFIGSMKKHISIIYSIWLLTRSGFSSPKRIWKGCVKEEMDTLQDILQCKYIFRLQFCASWHFILLIARISFGSWCTGQPESDEQTIILEWMTSNYNHTVILSWLWHYDWVDMKRASNEGVEQGQVRWYCRYWSVSHIMIDQKLQVSVETPFERHRRVLGFM